MRVQSVLILIMIGLSLLSPGSSDLPTGEAVTISIEALDVCNGGPSFVDPEFPCISTYPSQLNPLKLTEVAEIEASPSKPCLIAYQDERPPKS